MNGLSSIKVYFIFVALLVANLCGPPVFAASVSINPSSGPGNRLVTVSSGGFTEGTNAANTGFYIDTNHLVGICPQGPQYANCSIQVRMVTGVGDHTVEARNAIGESSNKEIYTVLPATLSVDKSCGPVGTSITLAGQNFTALANIGIVFNGSLITGLGIVSDEDGGFTATFPVPAAAEGSYTIEASGGGSSASAGFSVAPCVATVADVTGNPTATSPGGPPRKLKPGDRIGPNDVVQTGPQDRLHLLFDDNTQFTLSKNTKFRTDDYVFDTGPTHNRARYNFLGGSFQYVSGLMATQPDPNIAIETPFGSIGIRGTELISRRDPCSTTQEVYLIHGQLAIKPLYSAVTNIVDAPATIFFDATNIVTSGLTQAAYDALVDEINQTNLVTFASWLEGYFGCTNSNAAAAPDADPDGDGQNNYAEFLSRTDPTYSGSVFSKVSAAREGDGVRLVWQTHGGITNVVEAASTFGGTFSNISPNIIIPGEDDVTTNHLDAGVITNAPARFYRIRLVQ